MSDMLNQRHALAKLRAELEEKVGFVEGVGGLGTLPGSAEEERRRRK